MATDVLRHASSAKTASRAAKERREKIALVVGAVLLAGLLALEGPSTLHKLKGNSSTAQEATPAATTPAATPAAPASSHPVDMRALRHYATKDPFAPQLGATAATPTTAVAVTPPFVRRSSFVAKDPFVQQLTASAAGVSTGSGSAAGARGNLIVIVASVALERGKKQADAAAAKARAAGVPNVHVVLSSSYPTLRNGFYAVYSGPYGTLDQALKMLEKIRGRGYVSAYTRRLAR